MVCQTLCVCALEEGSEGVILVFTLLAKSITPKMLACLFITGIRLISINSQCVRVHVCVRLLVFSVCHDLLWMQCRSCQAACSQTWRLAVDKKHILSQWYMLLLSPCLWLIGPSGYLHSRGCVCIQAYTVMCGRVGSIQTLVYTVVKACLGTLHFMRRSYSATPYLNSLGYSSYLYNHLLLKLPNHLQQQYQLKQSLRKWLDIYLSVISL